MPGWEMRVNGLDDLKRSLSDLSKNQSARILNKALAAGCEVFRDDEVERCPERPDLPSGTALPPGDLKRDVDIKHKRGARALWAVGPGFYGKQAHLVEFGHDMVVGGKKHSGGQKVGRVPPHPYIRPAYEAGIQPAIDVIRQTVADELGKLRYKGTMKGSK